MIFFFKTYCRKMQTPGQVERTNTEIPGQIQIRSWAWPVDKYKDKAITKTKTEIPRQIQIRKTDRNTKTNPIIITKIEVPGQIRIWKECWNTKTKQITRTKIEIPRQIQIRNWFWPVEASAAAYKLIHIFSFLIHTTTLIIPQHCHWNKWRKQGGKKRKNKKLEKLFT